MPGQRGHHRGRARGGVPDGGARPGRGVLLPLQVTHWSTINITTITTHDWLQARPHLPPQEDLPPAEVPREPGRQQPRQPPVRC